VDAVLQDVQSTLAAMYLLRQRSRQVVTSAVRSTHKGTVAFLCVGSV
jgi:hypothetical protein